MAIDCLSNGTGFSLIGAMVLSQSHVQDGWVNNDLSRDMSRDYDVIIGI